MTTNQEISVLDDRATVERLDPEALLGRIQGLPEQCDEAWRRAEAFELPGAYASAREVVVLGMGGSAIAADILRVLSLKTGRKQISVVRGYELPPFVDGETLVVACSHSGNTEETVSAFEQALSAGAQTLVVTTGGRIEALARALDVPTFVYEFAGEPRSALGHQLMALLSLGGRIGLVEAQAAAVAETLTQLRGQRGRISFDVPLERNFAKQVASRLVDRLPVIVGAGVLTEAAHRWKTQLNENSKSWALHEELPELNHNTIVGFGLPRELVERMHVVFLYHASLHERVRLRYEITEEALAEAGVSHERVVAQGESALAQVLTSIYFGDLTSYYLALLYGESPAPVKSLDHVKARLSER
ncbi:MAG: bifunctional phosphoglucose/phosphomannose isomerase [Dehalococcoidia bacterium]